MIIKAETAVKKIAAGDATITGVMRGDLGECCVIIDDHSQCTVHHVEIPGSPDCMTDSEKTLVKMHG